MIPFFENHYINNKANRCVIGAWRAQQSIMNNLPQEAEILMIPLTQKKMAALFGVQRPPITKHLSNIFENKELE